MQGAKRVLSGFVTGRSHAPQAELTGLLASFKRDGSGLTVSPNDAYDERNRPHRLASFDSVTAAGCEMLWPAPPSEGMSSVWRSRSVGAGADAITLTVPDE